jgi:hypothetical protein
MVGSEVFLMATIFGFTRIQLCRSTRDNLAVKSSRSFDAHGKLIENTKSKLKAAVLPVLFWATSGQTDSPFRISAVEVKQRSRGLSPRRCRQLFIGK